MNMAHLKRIFAKNTFIGVDIGADSAKFVQFAGRENGLCLIRAELRDIKRGKTEEAGAPEAVSALRELFKGVRPDKSYIAVSIDCPRTVVVPVVTPRMPEAELRSAIRLDAKKYFPFSIDNSVMDFEILKEIQEEGTMKSEILAAVAPRVTVDKYLSILREAGITPDAVVPSVYAYRELARLEGTAPGAAACFLDIGKLCSELIIFKGSVLKFARKIPVTGKDFTEALTSVVRPAGGRMDVTWADAEKIKREIGIPATGELKKIDDKLSTMQILSALRHPLERLTAEIERCFDYYREEGGEAVGSLMLFGGGSSIPGLVRFLSQEVGVDVKLGDPFKHFQIGQKALEAETRSSYRFAPAVGAALTTGKGINLLPDEFRKDITKTVKWAGAIAAIGITVCAAIILYSTAGIRLNDFQKRVSRARVELAGMQAHLKKAEAFHLANMVLKDEPHWEDIFKEICNVIPDDIYFTGMDMRDKIITMTGVVTADDGEQDLSGFILNLRESMLKDGKLINIKTLDGRAGMEFKIRCCIN